MSTKEKVLSVLEERKGQSVSGERLAAGAGVSRAAIWKAIQSLREEGHIIDGGSGRGYVLCEDSDRLSVAGIMSYLQNINNQRVIQSVDHGTKAPWSGFSDKREPGEDDGERELRMGSQTTSNIKIVVHDRIDSTNKEAKRLVIDEPSEPILIVADEQTEGRGRLGRSFYSPAGSGVYMSFLLKTDGDISSAVRMTSLAAVAVSKAIENVSPARPGIKWVNDIYINGKKVCGILTEGVAGLENSSIEYVIVGIGINTHPAIFPAEAGENADSIESAVAMNLAMATGMQNTGVDHMERVVTRTGHETTEVLVKTGGPSSDLMRITRNELVANVCAEFMNLTGTDKETRQSQKEAMKYYRDHSIVIGKEILIYGPGMRPGDPVGSPGPGPVSGISGDQSENDGGIPTLVTGIDDNGGLEVRYEDGRLETINSGEITIRRKS